MKNYFFTLVFLLSYFIMPGQVLKCNPSIDYGNNASQGNYAQVNGIRMYYETYGDPANQPILLIHGNGGSVKAGSCQIEYFKDDYYVIIADSRHQGKSESGSKELTYRLMASDYNELLNHLKVDSVDVIGQSDGAILGLLLAIEYPSKVKKVVAAAPNLRPDSTALYQWSIEDMKSDLQKTEAKIASGDTSEEQIRNKALLQLMLNHPDIKVEELQKITAPVLITAGDEDYIKPEHLKEMYRNIPQANLFIMPGAGHRAYRLEPEIFNEIVQRFLENPYNRATAREGY